MNNSVSSNSFTLIIEALSYRMFNSLYKMISLQSFKIGQNYAYRLLMSALYLLVDTGI